MAVPIGNILAKYQALAERKMAERSESSKSKAYTCNTCQDESYIAVLDDGRTFPLNSPQVIGEIFVARPCQCLVQKQIERIYGSSGIQNTDKTFSNFVETGRPPCVVDAKETVMNYYKNFSRIRHERVNSLALLGSSGAGKTHLLTALCNNLIQKKQVSVAYFKWVEGMNALKSSMDKLDERIAKLQTVGVLYIDDLFKGRQEPTEFEFKQMFGVINYRNEHRLPILVSSELYMDNLMAVDEAFWSRIYEMSTVVQLGGDDLNYRMRGGNE